MVDVGSAEQRERLLTYLKAMLGEDVLEVIEDSGDVHIGERVLYRLAGDTTAARHEPSAEDVERLRSQMTRFASDTGGSMVSFEPPRSSNLPYPRLVDLPGSEIIWDTELNKYRESEDLLPARDFPLEWAIGVLRTSEDLILYLDFTHPRLKAVFRAACDTSGGLSAAERARLRDGFRVFRDKQRDLRRVVEADTHIAWAKIVQRDLDPALTRIKRID